MDCKSPNLKISKIPRPICSGIHSFLEFWEKRITYSYKAHLEGQTGMLEFQNE